ncbi:MAG: response regulator transcription factor [Paracoccaceae bacterium]|nr:MAG: response regulator transcription factor [Paracoccaceae bacterium]
MLLVEDNDELAEMVMDRFLAEGHAIDREKDGAQADALLVHSRFDLLILDINLPGLSGTELLRRLRARGDRTPVLILTARSEIDDRIAGLDSGADDYVVKPVDYRELAARARALIRRRSGQAANQFVAGGLIYDRAAKRATLNGVDLELRSRDVQLLEAFLGSLGRVLSKEEVADRLYTFEETPTLNAVEQAVVRLRRKLEGSPLHLRTIRGLGYIADVRD